MKKAILVGSVVAALFAGILFVHAAEQQQTQPQPQGPAMPMNPQMMMQNMMGMMQQAGVGPEIMQRCMAMMRTQVFLDSPAAIRGQAEVLGLSDEQVKKLLDIDKEARQKAKSVLTPEQTKKLGDIPDTPMAMVEMCQQMSSKMMPMMQKMMSEGTPGQPMWMCPMMQMMKREQTPQGSETKPGN